MRPRRLLLLRPFSTSPGTQSQGQSQLPPPEWVEPYLDISDTNTTTRTPSSWLSRVISLVLRSSPDTLAADLDAFCRTFLLRLSPSFVSAALRSLLFFRSCTSRHHHHHHHSHGDHASLLNSYVSLIHSFSLSSSAAAAAADDSNNRIHELVAEIKNQESLLMHHLTPASATCLIRSLASAGLIEELLWAWRAMKQSNIPPTLLTYNCLLDGLVNAGFVDAAQKVFDAMSGDACIQPDVVSYNTLIKGYCKKHRVNDAMARFGEMQRQERRDLAPDKVTYLTLIQCHYNEGMFPQCLSLYQEMDERGADVPPHAYTLAIGTLSKEGKPFEGLAMLDKMIKRECPLNVPVYTALIDSLAKCGRVPPHG